jgi:alpha-L-rhamnosidase
MMQRVSVFNSIDVQSLHGAKLFRCFLLFMVSIVAATASKGQPTPDSAFSASWITADYFRTSENTWYCFRKEVDISNNLPKSLIARIAVDSKYWLWINGKMVVFEGGLKRGPTPNDTYYDEVEIAPSLKPGKNTIAVLVWYWGRDGFCHNNSGKAGLFFDADHPDIHIKSDGSWQTLIYDAFGNTGDPIPNYRLPEFNIRYYASKSVPWQDPTQFPKMSNATAVGGAGSSPWGHLWKRPFPQWKNSGLVEYENRIHFPFVADGYPVKMKLPKNYAITPYFSIESKEGEVIDMRTDNYKGGSEYNIRTEYITANGAQEFETYAYMNGHEVVYSIPKGIKVMALKYRRTSFPTEHVGRFHSSDTSLNVLWEKCLNTMDINMRDAIQDPDRERAQWWGDAVTILGEIFYTCDSTGYPAIRKAMSNLVEWQKPGGELFSPIPAGKWNIELPTQMLAAIGKYGFWRYFQYTGDSATIRYLYPHVKRYLNLWTIGEDGLLVHRNGGWNWFDWGDNIDEALIENAWYYMALEAAKKMAVINNDPAASTIYHQKMQLIKNNFNRAFWNGNEYRSQQYRGETDDRGNGLAVVSGLADSSKYAGLKNVFATQFHAGPYLEKYILEALCMMHAEDAAIVRMKQRYSAMIESPVTTLWEGWEIGSATYGGGSYNHGWSGGPLTLMHEYLAGIKPQSPGYVRVAIMPQLHTLDDVQCITPTIRGNIMVDLKKTTQGLLMHVVLPKGIRATIGVPVIHDANEQVWLNGKLLVKKQVMMRRRGGIAYITTDQYYHVFETVGGDLTFKIQ